jgi:4-hydroxymandelate oxidase
MRYICTFCNAYVYDEDEGDPSTGLAPGTKITSVPADWRCPICGKLVDHLHEVSAEKFNEVRSSRGKRLSNSETKDIDYYRSVAREMLKGLCGAYNICDGSRDRRCIGQKFGRPIGVGGAGQGNTFNANYQALQRYRFRAKLVKAHHEPEMETEIFGRSIIAPVMGCSMSGVKASMNNVIPEEDFYRGLLRGAQKFGTLGLVGNTAAVADHLGIDMVGENKGWGIAVFKPQSQERLFELFKLAEECDAPAIGVDLDGCGSTIWAARGKPVYRKSESELEELVDCTDKPVFFKGIMTVEDALAVVDAGASGVYVSNHGGRVLDCGQGVAEVLPEIVDAVKGKATIMADGAVRTGYDVLKTLALGADVALIGRPLLRMSLAGGAEAVSMYYNYVKGDLRGAMIMTGCDSLKDVKRDILVPAGRE